MLVLIVGAKAFPYKFKDKEDKNRDVEGVSCSVRCVKLKGARQEQLKKGELPTNYGLEVTTWKTDVDVVNEVLVSLIDQGPSVFEVDVDVKGEGSFQKVVVTSASYQGPLTDYELTCDGLTKRQNLAPTRVEPRPSPAIPLGAGAAPSRSSVAGPVPSK